MQLSVHRHNRYCTADYGFRLIVNPPFRCQKNEIVRARNFVVKRTRTHLDESASSAAGARSWNPLTAYFRDVQTHVMTASVSSLEHSNLLESHSYSPPLQRGTLLCTAAYSISVRSPSTSGHWSEWNADWRKRPDDVHHH